MREHHIWVLEADGRAKSVIVEASTRAEAEEGARRRGLRLLQESRLHLWRGAKPRSAHPIPLNLGAAPIDEILAQQLQVLTRSGVGPVESLRALAHHATGPYAQILADLRQRLESGVGLADAAEATGRFDPLLVALLRAAERTSDLEGALTRFIQHRERMNAMRQRVITTAVYPVLLMSVGAAVLLFLLFQVVPRFSGIFQTMHADLPWAATLMLRWGVLVRTHSAWVASAALASVVAAALIAASPGVRAQVTRVLLRRGWLGQQMRLASLCRYYRTVASLLGGGIALAQSMSMAGQLLPPHMQLAGELALRQVTEGTAPATALVAAGLSTPIADQLVQVGQRTGQLAAMLDRVADFHDAEVGRNVERFMRALEPAVMTVVGIAIGVIVILMYLPIFELASAVR